MANQALVTGQGALSWVTLAQTVGASPLLLFAFAWLEAAVAGNTTQQVVDRLGRSNGQLWLMRPGIFVHEALHAVVGRLFGLHITEFSLRPRGDSAAHVSFTYAPHSWLARLGLIMSASAPVWGIGATLLAVGKRAWWPGQPWAKLGAVRPDWPWVAAWLVLTLLLTFGLALSPRDLRNMLAGLPVLVGVLGLCYLGLAWFWPAGLTAWWRGNQVAAGLAVAVLALSVVVNRLVAWLK